MIKSNGKAMGSDKLEAEDFTPDPISEFKIK